MKTENKTAVQPKKPVKKKKYVKWIVLCAVVAAVAIAAAIILSKALKKDEVSTKSTTYAVQEVTYGNVSTTISGSGNLTPVSFDTLTAEHGGEVTSVTVGAGDEVAEGDVIATVIYKYTEKQNAMPTDGAPTVSEDVEKTEDAEITAPYDGIIIEIAVAEGDALAEGGEILMIMGKDGFTMGIAVDELNIAAVSVGQKVTYTIDALDGTYSGEVTSISYNGSTSGSVTAYQIQSKFDYIEGVYPGMSASAQIVVEDSGDGLLVPVDAVYTSGDTNYVYMAPDGAETGTEFAQSEIDLSKMAKVTVTTGMSDGSYMIVKSDQLSKGDRILVKTVTSTATESEKDSSGRSGFPGGFPGGGSFPGGEGFDFGDFDFGDFDPSKMPSGGRPSGGFSGGYGG